MQKKLDKIIRLACAQITIEAFSKLRNARMTDRLHGLRCYKAIITQKENFLAHDATEINLKALRAF